jgi:hypothetical protein
MERPATMWRPELKARKMLIFRQRKVGLTRWRNFEPAAVVIACRNRSRSQNWCENPGSFLDFSQPVSCKARVSRNLMALCVAPPVMIRMKRCRKTQHVMSGFVWIATRLKLWRPAPKVQTTALNAICRLSASKALLPSMITGSASATRRIHPCCSQRSIQRTEPVPAAD